MDIEDCGSVIEFVKTHIEFTRMDLQESLGLNKSDAVYEIKKLIESGRIVKKDNGRSVRYRSLIS